jgi:hypothetical protein
MKWVLVVSPNGRDIRIETENGDKLTRYISGKIARSLAREHNRVVDYISGKPTDEKKEG